jgi:leader peptidase (prepilin peptidase)/N-methyltransferase
VTWLLAVWSAALGLVIGSFLNVVIWRVPRGESIVRPPSHCPSCGHEVRPRDNVPVVSWLLLRGRCRDCHAPISSRYPLVELATGVVFVLLALRIGLEWELPAYLYLGAIGVALAMIDIDVKRLPNAIVLPSYVVGAVLLGTSSLLVGDYGALLRAGIGLAAMGAAYLALAVLWKGSMGLGDVKLAGVLGLYLGYTGWSALAVGSISAFFLGGIFGLALILLRKTTRKSGIPFGPWMVLGAWVGILFGNLIWNGYLTVFGLAA